jgi:hypothetical protein
MNTTLHKEVKMWELGGAWTLATTAAVFAGLFLGAVLNDHLWPNVDVPAGVDILLLIDNPLQRLLITGITVGCFTGVAEWFVLRKSLLRSKSWILASVAGWAVGLATSESIGATVSNWSIVGAIGGAIIGIAQWSVLRRNTHQSQWWIVAYAVSGSIVLKWIPPNLSLFMVFEHPISFAIVGLVMGTFTGATLVWLMRPRSRAQSEFR